jgi:hypothetical protein
LGRIAGGQLNVEGSTPRWGARQPRIRAATRPRAAPVSNRQRTRSDC